MDLFWLKHHTIFKPRSVKDKESGRWKKKVYTIDLFKDTKSLPPHWICWVGVNDIEEWKVSYGYTEVTKDDDYEPEGVKLNESGQYQFKDAILMKTELSNYIAHRKRGIEKSEGAKKAVGRKHDALAAKEGAALSKAELSRIMDVPLSN